MLTARTLPSSDANSRHGQQPNLPANDNRFGIVGRPVTVTLTINGAANVYHTVYDANGRISTVDYPSGRTLLNV